MIATASKRDYRLVSQCLICSKPLGQDSKDSGFIFCHEHMTCTSCGGRLSASEARSCYDRFLESLDAKEGETEESVSHDLVERLHARCLITLRTPATQITQVELDFLNQLRLLHNMPEPNLDVSVVTNENSAAIYTRGQIATMNIEQLRVQLTMIESVAAAVKNAINQHANYRKEDDKKFDKLRFTAPSNGKVSKASLSNTNETSEGSTPNSVLPTKNTQTREEALKRFGEVWGLTDMSRIKTLFKDRAKVIDQFMNIFKLSEKDARDKANEIMVNGNPDLKKVEGLLE